MRVADCEKLVHTYAGLAARYFLDYVALAERCQAGVEDVVEEAEKIRRSSAQQLGASLSAQAARRDLIELRELYWNKFPNVEILELQPDYMVARAYSCAFCDGLRSLGVSPERMKELSDLACIPDEAAASGFNPAIRLELESRQMKGNTYCEWVLHLQEKKAPHLADERRLSHPTPTEETTEARAAAAIETKPAFGGHEDFEKYVLRFKEIRALYFLDYVDFVEAYSRNPNSDPMELARLVRYTSAQRQGARLAEQAEERTLEQFVELYWYHFPYTEALTLKPDRAIVRARRDPFYEAFRRLDVTEDRIRELSDLFCIAEEGATSGFDPRIEFQRRKHLMLGDTYNEWEFRLSQS